MNPIVRRRGGSYNHIFVMLWVDSNQRSVSECKFSIELWNGRSASHHLFLLLLNKFINKIYIYAVVLFQVFFQDPYYTLVVKDREMNKITLLGRCPILSKFKLRWEKRWLAVWWSLHRLLLCLPHQISLKKLVWRSSWWT